MENCLFPDISVMEIIIVMFKLYIISRQDTLVLHNVSQTTTE